MGAVPQLVWFGLVLIGLGMVIAGLVGMRRPQAGPDWRPAGARESTREAAAVLAAANQEAGRRGWPTRWDDRTRLLPLTTAAVPRQRPAVPAGAGGAPTDVYVRVPEPDGPVPRGVSTNLAYGERP